MNTINRWIVSACLLLLAAQAIASPAEKPNILVILVDDAGYNDFGFMGSPDLPTPQIDRLASMGTVLTDAHVTATVCSPSRAGIITGRYQQRFGHECNTPPDEWGMDPAESTMGDILGAAGYKTIFVGKWHLGNRTMYHPNNRGFDEFWGFLEGARSYFPDTSVDYPGNFRAILHNRDRVDFEGYLTDALTDRAIGYINSGQDKPWFLFLSYNAVHTPMDAKNEHLEKFSSHPRQKLAAMTWSLDENVGRILDTLEEQDLLESTIIFFLSDNGGAGFQNNQSSNHPLKGWKGNKYEGGHRVPFVVAWKGKVPAGMRYDGLSSSLDIMATAAAAAEATPDPHRSLDGINLIPFLDGSKSGEPHEELFWRKDRMAAMRWMNFKLVRLEGFGYRLYDLSGDLGETSDMSMNQPGTFARMKARLIEWDREMVAPWWYEDAAWNKVTYEIHRALMSNEEPNYITPEQHQSFLKSKKQTIRANP